MNEQLRRAVAAQHGLPREALPFLTGETVEEVEQSASKLTTLLREHRPHDHEPDDPSTNFFTAAIAAKAERQAAFVAALTGQVQTPPQTRDDRGRFAGGSFDGGARREPVPSEPETHDSWLVRTIRDRSANAGAHFWEAVGRCRAGVNVRDVRPRLSER